MKGKGISKLNKEKCDVLIKIPMGGQINSLNASVAGGIAMYEVSRQRLIKAVVKCGEEIFIDGYNVINSWPWT